MCVDSSENNTFKTEKITVQIEVHKEQWTETQGEGTEAKAFVYKRLMESIRRQQREQDKPIWSPSRGIEFRVRLKHGSLKIRNEINQKKEIRKKWRYESQKGGKWKKK